MNPARSEGVGALVAGASGAVGGGVLRALLASPSVGRVIALVRRPMELVPDAPNRERLVTVVVDLERLEEATALHGAGCELAFCTLGTGQPSRQSRDEVWKVDVEYAGAFARGAARAGAQHIALLSSVGADADSRGFYFRLKGAAERAVCDARIPDTCLYRPSLLRTDTARYGWTDRINQRLFPLLAPILPFRLRPIHVLHLGAAMVRRSLMPRTPGRHVLHVPDCRILLDTDET
jgi:uncharacterized protein YbjT (DUF2867 family)